ncbi:MAG: hypothetical protein OET44_20410 [Gammaproteobacteria bacterium]|nr:hypothetical protein [Gammaproteobacteria bacterium]
MQRHQYIALALFAFVSVILFARHGIGDEVMARVALLFVTLLPVLFYRQLASYSRFGFMQYFASDFRSGPHAAPFAVLGWLVFVIGLLSQFFEWSLV